MASPAQVDFFSSARITGIMQGLTDPRLLPVPLTWNARVPDVPSVDEEISAKYVGTLLIADIIADDEKAVTYSQGRFQFQTTQVPNIKMGLAMNQAMINALQRIKALGGAAGADDVGFFGDRWNKNVQDVKYGVELRKEVLKIAMLVDGLSYDRLGIKMSNVTFGMYTDLKVTPGTAWSSTAGTGLTDIQNLRQVAQQRYGINLNRATMSTPALRALVAQTEFQAQIKNVYLQQLLGGPTPVAPLQGDPFLKRLGELVIAGVGEPFVIELDDRRYWSQASTGAITDNRFHPISTVLLTATGNDGNANAYDFANCPVTEGIIGSMFPSSVMGQVAQGRGPIGYTTLADAALNPPGTITWGVARGMPRKHQNQSSAILNVGTLTETFNTAVPAIL
jgi:hypothetical protein